MNFLKIFGSVFKAILPGLINDIGDYVAKVASGDDVSDHELRKYIPKESETALQDEIKTEARKALGLLT